MMLLPIGHEEDSVRRWPWVSITIVALCVLLHLASLGGRDRLEAHAYEKLSATIEYYYTHPHLQLDARLQVYAPTTQQLVGDDWEPDEGYDGDQEPLPEDFEPDGGELGESKPSAAEAAIQQEELDRLSTAYFESLSALPEHRWGLVPAKPTAAAYLTSMFAHGGWEHLLGNLFLLWLAGPALEDRWGRPLFAVFYLLCGLVGGVLWVGRFADSWVPLVGASGAIAGLMGAFAVRFWSTRIRFFYFFFWLLPPKIFSGTFQAPAWIMLGLWGGREFFSAAATDEFTAAIGGGTAYWVHVWGFIFGLVVATTLRWLKLEEKVLAPKIETKLGTVVIVNQPLEEAHRLRQEGRGEEAWQTLRKALAQKPGDVDVALASWDLGRELGRPTEAAAPLLQAIRHELRRGENDLALAHWEELASHLGELRLDLDLRLRLAEACLKERREEDAAELLAEVDRQLDPQLPVGLLARLARTAAAARSVSAPALVAAVLARPELPAEVRAELAETGQQLRTFGLRERQVAGAVAPSTGPIPLAEGPIPLASEGPIPLSAEDAPAWTLQVMAAVPQALRDGKIAVDLEGQGRRVLPLTKVVAVAAARIVPFGERPFVVIDLLIDPPAAGRTLVRTVRLRSLDFDAAALVGAGPSGEEPLATFVDQLLAASGATPMPDGQAARGRPFQTFPSLEEYQRRVLGT